MKGKPRWDGMASQGEREREREKERERNRRLQRSNERDREGGRGRGKNSWSESSRGGSERGSGRERSDERTKPKMSFMEEALNRSRDLAKAAKNHIPVAVFDTPVEESWTGGGLGLAGPSRPLGAPGLGGGGCVGLKKRATGVFGATIAPPPSLAAPQQRMGQTFNGASDIDWGSTDSDISATAAYLKAGYNANIEIPHQYPSSHPFNDENIVNPLFSRTASETTITCSRLAGRGGHASANGGGISRKERERMRDLARVPQRPGAAIPPPPLLTQPSQPPVVDEMGFEVEQPLSSPEPSPSNSPSHVQSANPVVFSSKAVPNPIFNSKPLIGPTQSSLKSIKPGAPKVSSGIGAKIMAK